MGLYAGTKRMSATNLTRLGVDDRVLAAVMGHAEPRSVEYYAEIDAEHTRAELISLNRAKRGEPASE